MLLGISGPCSHGLLPDNALATSIDVFIPVCKDLPSLPVPIKLLLVRTTEPVVLSNCDLLLFLLNDAVTSWIVPLYSGLLVIGWYLLNLGLSKKCGSINTPVLSIDFCGVNFLINSNKVWSKNCVHLTKSQILYLSNPFFNFLKYWVNKGSKLVYVSNVSSLGSPKNSSKLNVPKV